MWATLETWLLGDGEVPPLRVGEVLAHKGLRLSCTSLGPAEQLSTGAWVVGNVAKGDISYRIRAAVDSSWSQAAVLGVNGSLILAEPSSFRRVASANGEEAWERYAEDFRPPAKGRIAEAFGRLEVVPDYEWDAYHQVDARRNWLLTGVFIVRQPLVPVDPTGDTVTHGSVERVSPAEGLEVEADSGGGNSYLIELQVIEESAGTEP